MIVPETDGGVTVVPGVLVPAVRLHAAVGVARHGTDAVAVRHRLVMGRKSTDGTTRVTVMGGTRGSGIETGSGIESGMTGIDTGMSADVAATVAGVCVTRGFTDKDSVTLGCVPRGFFGVVPWVCHQCATMWRLYADTYAHRGMCMRYKLGCMLGILVHE